MTRRIRPRVAVRLQQRARAVLHARRRVMIFTVVARIVPLVAARPRSTSSSICSSPRCRSHHRLALTRIVSSPASSSAPYACRMSGVTHASCQPVIPSACRSLLRHEQRPAPLRLVGPRHEAITERVRGALVQRAGRLPRHGVAARCDRPTDPACPS